MPINNYNIDQISYLDKYKTKTTKNYVKLSISMHFTRYQLVEFNLKLEF